jgi:hypothetical protein
LYIGVPGLNLAWDIHHPGGLFVVFLWLHHSLSHARFLQNFSNVLFNTVTCISSAKQRLAKHLSQVTQLTVGAPLLGVQQTITMDTEVEPLKEATSTRVA